MPRPSSPTATHVVRTGPGIPFAPAVPQPPRVDGARRVVRMDDEEERLADQNGRELETAQRLGRQAGGR